MAEKLLFSTEAYDSIFDGPRPNGSCALWMIPEYGKPTIPHTLGEWNFFDEDGKMFDKDMLRVQAFPNNFNHLKVEYKYPHEIEGKKHLKEEETIGRRNKNKKYEERKQRKYY